MVVAKAGSPAVLTRIIGGGAFLIQWVVWALTTIGFKRVHLTDHLFYGGNQVFIHHIFRQQSSGARLL
jgi:hypothetical protein